MLKYVSGRPNGSAAPIIARIDGALARRDYKEALAQAEFGLAQGLFHPTVFMTIAEARMEAGRFAEAGDLLNKALALNRADPDCLCALGRLLTIEGRADEATTVYAQVLTPVPTHVEAWLGLARALENLEKDNDALRAYERAAELKPADPASFAGMAEVNLRAGRATEALTAAKRALSINMLDPVANLVRARISLTEKQAEDARRRAEALIVRGKLPPLERLTAFKTLGDALNQLDRIPEAVSAYERMNQATVALHHARFGAGGRVENHLDFMDRLSAGYSLSPSLWRTSPKAVAPSPVTGHVFVLGYPRSGNTLAAAVLGALPKARILEERPTLFDADLAFLRDRDGLSRLAEIDIEEAERLRALYWARARKEVADLDDSLFIDMAPLNSIKLPMIRKLFPDATIILCKRDPRDVVLSCWRQNFKMNASTYQMTSLVGTAHHFAKAMTLTTDCLSMIDGKVHHLQYEAFMADFEGGARRLLQAAGVEWDETTLDFAAAAKGRKLRTASADQIRGGLFDGRGQWKRYKAYLQPVMPILEPWLPSSGTAAPDGSTP